jgi:hypothetical protein
LKKLGRALLALGTASWLLAAACSVVVDAEPLEEGCPEGTKACEVAPGKLSCVSRGDPEYGCARDSCVPCWLPHAREVCGANGECSVGTCDFNYRNCDALAFNGCEVDHDADYFNCGGCDNSCDDALRSMPEARSAQCSEGRCVVEECEDGYADCDGAASNGCEMRLPEEACGRCAGCPGSTACNSETRRCE